jgi:prepilin-type N-terminal cleavage/methylation domain-containing protein
MMTKYNAQGFTLIEMMVVVVLVSLLLLGVSNLFFGTIIGGGKANQLAELKDQGESALQTIERVVREGYSLSCPDTNTVTVRDKFGVDIETITLSGGQISLLSGELTGSKVFVEATTFADCELGMNSFTPDKVTINFILSTGGGVLTEAFKSTISQRNIDE